MRQLICTSCTEPGIVPSLAREGVKDGDKQKVDSKSEYFVRYLNQQELEATLPKTWSDTRKFYALQKFTIV